MDMAGDDERQRSNDFSVDEAEKDSDESVTKRVINEEAETVKAEGMNVDVTRLSRSRGWGMEKWMGRQGGQRL